MTTGGDDFEFTDDAVVAKLSIDVPPGSAESLRQINQQAEQLRVELEAIARAESTWIEYLQQVPQLTEQAAAAQRNLITQLERTSYLQQQLGSLSPGIGQGGGIPGQGTYSTAAPAGYVDPFSGAIAGLGTAGRVPTTGPVGSSAEGAGAAYASQLAQTDPQLYANIAAQRGAGGGRLISTLKNLGMYSMTGLGSDPGSGKPGTGKADGGAEAKTVPTYDDADIAEIGKDLDNEQAVTNTSRHSLLSRGLRTSGMLAGRAGLRGAQNILGGLGDAAGGGASLGLMSKMGMAGTAIAGVGLASQNIGEWYQGIKNLGSVRGGGFAQGAEYEMQARLMSLNPFIDLQQAREVMQAGLREGYTGKTFDTVTKFMTDNLKNMNIGVSDSVALLRTNVDKGKMSVSDLGKALGQLREESKTGRVALPEKVAEYQKTSEALAATGITGDTLSQGANRIGEQFKMDPILGKSIPQGFRSSINNPGFQMMMAKANNVQGVTLPSTVLPKMQEQGIDPVTAWNRTMQWFANNARQQAGGDDVTGAGIFQMLLGSYGYPMDMSEAIRTYKQFVGGGGDIADSRGRQSVNDAANQQTANQNSVASKIGRGLGDAAKAIPGVSLAQKLWGFINHDGTTAADLVKEVGISAIPGGGLIEEQIKRSQKKPTVSVDPTESYEYPTVSQPSAAAQRAARQQAQQAPVSTQPTQVTGTVQGNLHITVDPQTGRIQAPPTVALSGHQKAVNAGYGGATMNNPSPGDPTYNHSYTGWDR